MNKRKNKSPMELLLKLIRNGRFIAIFSLEGGIGAGKTTLIKSGKFPKYINGCRVIIAEEPIKKWLAGLADETSEKIFLLTQFYKDMQKFYNGESDFNFTALSFQMYAFQTRIEAILEAVYEASLEEKDPDFKFILIEDRSYKTDYNVFAKLLNESNQMRDCDFVVYKNFFNFITKELDTVPHASIYLNVDPSIRQDRLIKRNRECETTVSLDYQKALDKAHFEMYESFFNKMYIKEVDWNLDFSSPDFPDYFTKVIYEIIQLADILTKEQDKISFIEYNNINFARLSKPIIKQTSGIQV